ncbi:hypothetical protein GW17_00030853 [Ensete ventricosum]|nr:hypothetical protein GW17_00030853 [Ensete ventricosum]
MEDKLLNLTGSTEALKVDLPKKVVADYKKTTGFEMGLVWTGQARVELEVEEDTFKILPEDSSVPMEAKQPFNDSMPQPEE